MLLTSEIIHCLVIVWRPRWNKIKRVVLLPNGHSGVRASLTCLPEDGNSLCPQKLFNCCPAGQ